MTAECALCERNACSYDLALLCCRVRLLREESRRHVRAAYLERWKQYYGTDAARETEDAFRVWWAESRRTK